MSSFRDAAFVFLMGLSATAPLVAPHAAKAQPIPTAESTLLLTWFEDPTTTMAVQWLTEGDLPPRTQGSAARVPMPVPQLDHPLTFDGRVQDWGVRGVRVDYLQQPNGGWPHPEHHAAQLKLGWIPQGLAVLVTVTDDELTPATLTRKQHRGDRIELRLTGQGGAFNMVIGVSQPGQPAVAARLSPVREDPPLAPTAALVHTDTGYVAEVLLPWAALRDFTPKDAARCRLQVDIYDRDGPFGPERLSLPQGTTLVLAPAGRVDAVRACVGLRVDPTTGARRIAIGGEPRLIGETVTVKSGQVTLAKVLLERVSGYAGAEWVLPQPWTGPMAAERLEALTLELDGRTLAYANFDRLDWVNPPQPGLITAVQGQPAPPAFPQAQVIPFGRSGWFLHRVGFTGLAPATDYVVAVPGRLAPVRFRTAPATLDQPLVFAEGGDVGTSHHVGQLHALAAAWDPLFGLVGGDCAYGNGSKHEKWFDFLKLWNDHMAPADGRSVPMIAAIGNHETRGSFGKTPDHAPFFNALFGPAFSPRGHYGVIDFGGSDGVRPYASMYLLDSGHTHAHGGQQTRWLEHAFKERRGVDHQLVAYHVPAYPSHRALDGTFNKEAREHWVPLFETYRIDAAFEHHDHTYKRTHRLIGDKLDPNGVLYLGDGCWGRPPRSVDDPLRPYLAVAKSERNVLRVTLNPDGTQSVLAINEHGEVLDDIEISAKSGAPAPRR